MKIITLILFIKTLILVLRVYIYAKILDEKEPQFSSVEHPRADSCDRVAKGGESSIQELRVLGGGGGWWVVVLKGTLVFIFGPNL